MVNFLALLGWSPGTDEELMSLDELVARFSMERVLRKGSVFDPAKLQWMNGRHMVRLGTAELAARLRRTLAAARPPGEDQRILTDGAFERMTEALAPRSRSLSEMAALAAPYVGPVRTYDPKAARKGWYRDPGRATEVLSHVRSRLAEVPWEAETLEASLRGLASELGVGAGKLFQPLRLALTGLAASPGIFDVLLILGRQRSLGRIERAIDTIASRATGP